MHNITAKQIDAIVALERVGVLDKTLAMSIITNNEATRAAKVARYEARTGGKNAPSRKPIADNGDDPSIAHATPKAKAPYGYKADGTPRKRPVPVAAIAAKRAGKGSRKGIKNGQTAATTDTRKADPKVGTGANMAANWDGRMMKADAGTCSKGQVEWLKANGYKMAAIRKLSMVEASNIRHAAKA